LLLNHQLKEYATMQEVTTTAVEFPSTTAATTETTNVLTEILREGAQSLLARAVEAEVAEWIERHAHLKDESGRQQVVRNGRLPRREITTGLGPIEICQPRVHDRRDENEAEKFTSQILPPYLRKTKSIEELIPWLYLKGISTGDFGEALQSLLGRDVPGRSRG
jgi:putative transposase